MTKIRVTKTRNRGSEAFILNFEHSDFEYCFGFRISTCPPGCLLHSQAIAGSGAPADMFQKAVHPGKAGGYSGFNLGTSHG
jgi:hypothetical protein